MRRAALLGAATLLVGFGVASGHAAAGKPRVLSVSAQPPEALSKGGRVTVTARVQNASRCWLEITPKPPKPVAELQAVSCASGRVKTYVRLPHSISNKGITYAFSVLIAKPGARRLLDDTPIGAGTPVNQGNGGLVDSGHIAVPAAVQASEPPPGANPPTGDFENVSASPLSFDAGGGTVTVSFDTPSDVTNLMCQLIGAGFDSAAQVCSGQTTMTVEIPPYPPTVGQGNNGYGQYATLVSGGPLELRLSLHAYSAGGCSGQACQFDREFTVHQDAPDPVSATVTPGALPATGGTITIAGTSSMVVPVSCSVFGGEEGHENPDPPGGPGTAWYTGPCGSGGSISIGLTIPPNTVGNGENPDGVWSFWLSISPNETSGGTDCLFIAGPWFCDVKLQVPSFTEARPTG